MLLFLIAAVKIGMAIPVSQIDRWRGVPSETQVLEFKEAKNSFPDAKLFRYCVALANEGGGHLILGVSDRPPREVVGTDTYKNPVKTAAKVFQKLHFRVEIHEVAHPGGRVIVFEIPGRPAGTAYQCEGSYLMRAGEELVPMSEDRLRRIFAEGAGDWLKEPAARGCSAEDIVTLLDTQSYFDLIGLPYPDGRDAVLERFASEQLIVRAGSSWDVTNLGGILFAKSLNAFDGLRRKALRIIVYDGQGKLKTKLDRTIEKGYAVGFEPLVLLVDGLIESNEVIERALREETKMFPLIAIRELLANALIHQEFTETGASVMIELFNDRIEISNPGRPDISTDRFIDEYRSRNETLADLMRRLKICEEKGSGVDKVINAAEFFQLPAPDFRASENRTTAILFAPQEIDEMERDARVRACYQHACLRYVMNEKMTNQSLRSRFKLPAEKGATVSQIISATLKADRIKVADPDQASTRYRSYVPFWA